MSELPGWPHAAPPFHPGETALQQRLGAELAERMQDVGRRVVRAEMPDQHRELFHKLPFVLIGARDAAGRPWASAVAGAPQAAVTPDARTLRLRARPLGEATLGLGLAPGAWVGLLGLELPTRRRNRANGRIRVGSAGGLDVAVMQSFGNCPKYIQRRHPRPVQRSPDEPVALGHRLDEAATAMIGAADTCFIATVAPPTGDDARDVQRGLDVSHRGGRPGFVRVGHDGLGRSVLTLPDFAGNRFFNTLGNLQLDPRAGLLFIDWHGGDLLALTGTVAVDDSPAAAGRIEGAERLLCWTMDAGWRLPHAWPFAADEAELSPHLAGTGVWPADVAQA